MAGHVFISYSSKNQDVADGICAALEERGLQCWISSRNIPPGANFQEAIVRAIRAAGVMVLVFSRHANASNEIKKELALASRTNITVFPLRIEEVTPDEAFAYEFATRQWIDLFEDRERALDQLAAEISRIAGIAASPAASAETASRDAPIRTTPAPKGRAGHRRWLVAGAAAAAVVVLVGVAGHEYLQALPTPPPRARAAATPKLPPQPPVKTVALSPPPAPTPTPTAAAAAPAIAAPKPAFEARVLDVLDSRTLLLAGHGPVYLYGIKVKNLDESQAEADRTRQKMKEFFDVNGGSVSCYKVAQPTQDANLQSRGFRCFTKDRRDVAEWAVERGLAAKDPQATASSEPAGNR